jgi:hypothetical protein
VDELFLFLVGIESIGDDPKKCQSNQHAHVRRKVGDGFEDGHGN